MSSLLFAVRASTVATALRKVTIIYGWVAHSHLLRILISYLTEHTQPAWIKIKQLDYFAIGWFSRYVIAAMLVDGKQKIAH